jgi:Zn-dependent peptidase ImmA (M78 family)
VPSEIVTVLPKLRMENTLRSVSSASVWDQDNSEWVIHLNRFDTERRQRFALFREFKNIIDHGRKHVLYAGPGHYDPDAESECAADYFAGCVLVSKKFLERAWKRGVQKVADLARLFGVSEALIDVRLRQTGVLDCADGEERVIVRTTAESQPQCRNRQAHSWWWRGLTISEPAMGTPDHISLSSCSAGRRSSNSKLTNREVTKIGEQS